jgi:hypothetical protein
MFSWRAAEKQLYWDHYEIMPITVAVWSMAWCLRPLERLVVDSNPTRGMKVYVCLFCVRVDLCVGRSLVMGWSPVQGVLTTVYTRITKLKKKGHGQTRAVEPLPNESVHYAVTLLFAWRWVWLWSWHLLVYRMRCNTLWNPKVRFPVHKISYVKLNVINKCDKCRDSNHFYRQLRILVITCCQS